MKTCVLIAKCRRWFTCLSTSEEKLRSSINYKGNYSYFSCMLWKMVASKIGCNLLLLLFWTISELDTHRNAIFLCFISHYIWLLKQKIQKDYYSSWIRGVPVVRDLIRRRRFEKVCFDQFRSMISSKANEVKLQFWTECVLSTVWRCKRVEIPKCLALQLYINNVK